MIQIGFYIDASRGEMRNERALLRDRKCFAADVLASSFKSVCSKHSAIAQYGITNPKSSTEARTREGR